MTSPGRTATLAPVTSPQQPTRPRWVLAVLTALMVVAALVLAAGTASAATAPAAENRIRAPASTAQVLDRPPQDVAADQRLGNTLPQWDIVVATGVARNTAARLSPGGIRFSQNSVNGAAEIEASMRANGWVGDAIDVVRMRDGGLTSVDNTRLLAAKRAGIDVQANVHGFDDLIPEDMAGRFLSRKGDVPTTWGDAVLNRIGSQSAGYRNQYPSGSPLIGWTGN